MLVNIHKLIMTKTERQKEIIEAAGIILTKSGVSGLTIKNIAKQMHFSESAIYRHFDSKEDIILGMLEHLAVEMDLRCSILLSNTNDPKKNFLLLFNSQVEFFDSHKHFVVAVFSDGLIEESEKINDAINRIMKVKLKHLKPILVTGQKLKIFNPEIEIVDLIHIILGSFRLLMYKWRISNFDFELKQSADSLLSSLISLIEFKPKQ